MEEAFWITSEADPMTGAPTFDFAAYETNSSLWTTMVDGSVPPFNPKAIDGNWMVGIMKNDVVERSFVESGIPVPNPLPVYGYITHDLTNFSFQGDLTKLPWYDPVYEEVSRLFFIGSISPAIACVSKIFQYFNSKGVTHIVFDQRSAAGGGSAMAPAISILSGGDRSFSIDELSMINRLEPNGVSDVYSEGSLARQLELEGLTYPVLGPLGLNTYSDCKPSVFEQAGVPVDGFFRGTVDQPRNIMWIHPNQTISATQLDLCTIKGTSLDKSTWDGDLGSNTTVAVYGSYVLPFSTGGGFDNIVQWYGKNRAGEEPLKVPPLFLVDRYEVARLGYRTDDDVLQALDQDFNQLTRPHILWDMNSDVWIQDIGFVTGSPSVDPSVDGEPWVAQRPNVSTFVDYNDGLTWRDAILDRVFIMGADPNLKDNFYAQNTYGFIANPTPQ